MKTAIFWYKIIQNDVALLWKYFSIIACFHAFLYQTAFNEVTFRSYAFVCLVLLLRHDSCGPDITSQPFMCWRCNLSRQYLQTQAHLAGPSPVLWDLALSDVSIGKGVCWNLNCLCRAVPKWSSCVKYAWYCSSWFVKVRLSPDTGIINTHCRHCKVNI